MNFKRKLLLSISIMPLIVSACRPANGRQASSNDRLALPKSVVEAALVNYRPLTDTGKSLGPVWSPDGKTIAYSELSFVPNLASYHSNNGQPNTDLWVASADGKDKRFLDIGIPLFYNKDGSEIYYQVYDPTDKTPSVYAIDPITKKTRHFLGTQGFPNIYALADGRLVLSEVGNYHPIRILDPATGERIAYMQEHPSNAPQDARISPDGKLMAYPKGLSVYLSKVDGSLPIMLTQVGGGAAKVWWSPDSKFLAYSTGNTMTDKMVLVDRQGNQKAIMIQRLGDIGYISSVVWSPDSRWMLISAEAFTEYARPTRLFLFDLEGNYQLLLESDMGASPAWSPDGHTLALSLWIGPNSDHPSFSIWLANLTDAKTAADLPKTMPPAPQPTPTMAVVSTSWSPEQVIRSFWETVGQKDYHAAWSMLSEPERANLTYPDFRAFYECFQSVSISGLQEVKADEKRRVFSLKIEFQRDPQCNDLWSQAYDFYATMVKANSTDPWQIACFNGTPDCAINGR